MSRPTTRPTLRPRAGAAVLVALVIAALVVPAPPRAEAASAQFVLTVLDTLRESYVDPLPAPRLLNAALDSLHKAFGASPFGGPIPSDATDIQAAGIFTQRFDELLSQVSDHHPATDLAFAAAEGMLDSLHDSHTGFIPPALYQEEKRRESGQAAFTGVGIVLLTRDGQFYVNEVYPGGPAEAAGVHAFDRVLAVDGKATGGMTEEDVSAMIRGPAGTRVTLTLGRPGETQPVVVTIVREPITVPGVASRMLESGIGYVRLYEFIPGAGGAFRSALLALRHDGMRAMVLDLRGNPGGLVEELRDIAGSILPQGAPVLQMRTRGGREVTLRTSDPPILPESLPLAVLVDGDTGSAAELLTAAVQEQSRGVVTGTKTAGAVEIGITVDLPEGAGMSVTVARVRSGKGTRLEGQGVVPDVQENLTTAALRLGHDSQLDRVLDFLRARLGAKVPGPLWPAGTVRAF